MTLDSTAGLWAPRPEPRRHHNPLLLMGFDSAAAIITGHDGQQPLGFFCRSVTTMSFDPPYVSFHPTPSSSTWPVIRSTGRMCINLLSDDQARLYAQFARDSNCGFDEIDWSPAGNGAPQLHCSLATVEADLEYEHCSAEQTTVVAHVTAVRARGEGTLMRQLSGCRLLHRSRGRPDTENTGATWLHLHGLPPSEGVYASLTDSVRRLVVAAIRSQPAPTPSRRP